MAASVDAVKRRVTDIINLQTPGQWTSTIASTNLDRNAQSIDQAVMEAALTIAKAIVANPNHVHRNVFVSATPTSLTNGSELPDMAGPHDIIEIQPYSGADWITGVPRTMQQIDSFRANTSSLYSETAHTVQGSPIGGYYAIDNGRVKFTGNAARIYFPVIDRDDVTTLIPDEYEGVWTCLSASLVLKEGDNLQGIAAHYLNLGLTGLQALSGMSSIQPTVFNGSRGDT